MKFGTSFIFKNDAAIFHILEQPIVIFNILTYYKVVHISDNNLLSQSHTEVVCKELLSNQERKCSVCCQVYDKEYKTDWECKAVMD